MFRPVRLSFNHSAAGQFSKGRSKAHKQLSALSRPAERREHHSGQQLAVDADGTVSHSAVVAFLTGPVQMMLVHEAVQHSLRFGQQLAGDKVTLPCRPRDWHVVNIPSPMSNTDSDSRTMKIKTTVKQPTAVCQACSSPTSSPVKSSHEAKGTDSSETPQPCPDAPIVVTTVQSITEPQAAVVGFSSPDTTTTISGPSPTLLADVPLSPATSSPLSALEEVNSSTLCEAGSLATIAADTDTMWTTGTWTYQDVFKDYEVPKPSASFFSTARPSLSNLTTMHPAGTDSGAITHLSAPSNNQDIETATSSSLDVFVEISLTGKVKATKAQTALITAAGQQEDAQSWETFQDLLSSSIDTTDVTYIAPSCKAFNQPPTESAQVHVQDPNSSKQTSAMGSSSVVEATSEPKCEPKLKQQPAAPTPCSSIPSMQPSMAAAGTVQGTQGTLALRDKLACRAAGLRQSVADKLRSLHHWRPAAWAW